MFNSFIFSIHIILLLRIINSTFPRKSLIFDALGIFNFFFVYTSINYKILMAFLCC